jgi:phosphate:Na+ symporter
MSYSIWDFLGLLGSLGIFIYGMKVMSEGIQKVAGSKMRQILGAMTSNRFKGLLTGLFITGLLQSSSATTVMVVSFVNAGLLSLTESIGVIMGANIGTTVTAWIIALVGFKIKISAYALPILAIGTPLLFASKSRPRAWGEVLIGFALLFMGLSELKGSVPNIQENPEILEFLQHYTDLGFLSVLMFVGIGTLLTIVVQSSSAAMAVTLVMANQGWVPFELAAAMVLGENIGTTITANLAAMIANVYAKRAARAHFIFNIFGVLWMLALFYPFTNAVASYVDSSTGASPFVQATAIPIALSLFHTTFNIINSFVMIWFVNTIANIVIKMIPSRGDDVEFHLEFIGSNILSTPEISILEARREIVKMGSVTLKMSEYVQELIVKKKSKKRARLMDKIQRYEEITDTMEVEVATFLSKVAEGNIREESSFKIRALLSINNDLERVGDLFYQMSLLVERKHNADVWFSDPHVIQLDAIFKLLDEALQIMSDNLSQDYSKVTITTALNKEREINAKRNELRRDYFRGVEKGEYDVQSALIYSELIQTIEKVGDHVINVTEAITGQI